ncbi:MAG TPA: hypothetical protein VKY22_08375 [Bradyrhizobium sp.]|nr:hypothetical protein [Bradyrhizobium sp.]
MAKPRPWSEMTVEQKLEILRHDEDSRQRQMATMARALDELWRRMENLERRVEETWFS